MSRLYYSLDAIFLQILGIFLITLYWDTLRFYDLQSPHAQHVLLCASGIAMNTGSLIHIFSKYSIFNFEVPRKKRIGAHIVLFGLGTTKIILGIIVKILQKEEQGAAHFKSAHAVLGLISMILIVLVGTGGAMILIKKIIPGRKGLMKTIHTAAGIVTYIIGVITLCLGLRKLSTLPVIGGWILLALACLHAVYCLVTPVMSLLYQIKVVIPEEQISEEKVIDKQISDKK